ncbi:MAG: hypothetical protein KDK63_01495, partial [Chlamydiia bacterium]|nr:hypothetical protein [Chlamydiia bacterium]
YFMQYLVAKKIPIFSLAYALRNASPIKETLYELFKKEPIQQFVTQRKPDFLSLRPPLPALHELIEALTPKAIEAMPPHLIFAWGAALHQNHQAFSSLDFNQRLAFVLRFEELGFDIPDALYSDAINTQIKSQPDQCGPKALSWMLQKEMQKAKDGAIKITHTNLPLFVAAHKKGVPLPPFKLKEAILGNSATATEIETLFRAYPLYQFIGKNQEHIQKALKKPLPTLETLTKTLTLASVQTMGPHSVRAWHAILKANANRGGFSSAPVSKIAVLARFKELGLKMDDFEQRIISTDDLKQYSLETLKFLSAGFGVSLDDVTEITNENQIAFLKAWHEKGGEVPPFTDNRHEKTENLDALNPTYPHYRFLQGKVIEMEGSGGSKPPTFSSFAKNLTPNAVNKMSSLQLKAYLEVLGKDASRWDNLAPKVALAFLQQFFAHHLITEVPEGAKKHVENIETSPTDYSKEEIQWYLQTCLTPKEERYALYDQPELFPKIYTITPELLPHFEKALNDGIQLPLF